MIKRKDLYFAAAYLYEAARLIKPTDEEYAMSLLAKAKEYIKIIEDESEPINKEINEVVEKILDA